MFKKEVNEFLETFFTFYPTANEKELTYYVSNHALPVINKEYVFVELMNPIYTTKDNQIVANIGISVADHDKNADDEYRHHAN